MPKNNNHINYSSADIERYLKGEMPVKEMHALEKAALDDPFLADAVEGIRTAFSQHGAATVISELNELNDQLKNKTSAKRKPAAVIRSVWVKYTVAAAILIVAALLVFNNYFQPEPTQSLAVTEKAIPEKVHQFDTVSDQNLTTRKQDANQIPQQAPVSNEIREPDNKRQAEPDKIKSTIVSRDATNNEALNAASLKTIDKETRLIAKGDSTISDKLSVENKGQIQPTSATAEKPAELIIVQDPAKNNYLKKDSPYLPEVNQFSGRVVNKQNEPLANASIVLRNQRRGIQTDKFGFYHFKSPDSILNVQVDVAGYRERNVELKNNITLQNIVLDPVETSLDEVVVTGYGTERSSTPSNLKNVSSIIQRASPVPGWIAYEHYLDSNKIIPVSDSAIHGEVSVSFDITKSGIPTNFKIEKSLAPSLNREAIRLIKDGPRWKLVSGKKARAKVIVSF